MTQRLVPATVGGLALAAGFIHSRVPLPSDVAYFVMSAERLLDGARPYRDIVENNPPLAFWVTLPPVAAARLLGVAPAIGLVTAVVTAALAVVAWLNRLWRRGGRSAAERAELTLALAAILLLLPAGSFGQREHLAVMALVPYLALVALRGQGQPGPAVDAWAAGALAGLGLAFKPYFLLIPAAAELHLLLTGHGWRSTLRRETLAMAVPLALYPFAMWLATPLYLSRIVPLGLETYGAFNLTVTALLAKPEAKLLLLFAGLALGATLHLRSRRAAFWLAAAAGGLLVYFVQAKGSVYHALPGFALLAITLAELPVPRLLRAAVLAGLIALWHYQYADYQRFKLAYLDRQFPPDARGSVLLLTHDIGIGFPYLQARHLTWAGRCSALWMLPAALNGSLAPQRAAQLFAATTTMVGEDLAAFAPDHVLVDRRADLAELGFKDADYVARFSADPLFAAAWSQYERAGGDGRFEIWRRRPDAPAVAGRDNPWNVLKAREPFSALY